MNWILGKTQPDETKNTQWIETVWLVRTHVVSQWTESPTASYIITIFLSAYHHQFSVEMASLASLNTTTYLLALEVL